MLRRKLGFDKWRVRDACVYENPTDQELQQIERRFADAGIKIIDFEPSVEAFHEFKESMILPAEYHAEDLSNVRDEKLLEHWIAAEKLNLWDFSPNDVYVDVAACGSPWAKVLREKFNLRAFAIDLEIPDEFSDLDFYREEDATRTQFADSSVKGISLQCAFEMFMQDDDRNLISECSRILKPGGKVIILPLYMHTHYCAYSTPEYFGKGHSDPAAEEYVRTDCWGVPSSRKYDVGTLMERVLSVIEGAGLTYAIHALRNKAQLGNGIYCHFVLEIEKPI